MPSPRTSTIRIEHLVLDWNGTVVEDVERAWRATQSILEDHGLPTATLDEFRTHFTLPLRRFFGSVHIPTDRLDDAERTWNQLISREPAQLTAGTSAVLAACHTLRIPVGVISGADATVVGADASRLGIGKLLSWVVGSSSDKYAELQTARRQFGPHIAYVGDTTQDIVDAQRADVVAIAYTNGYNHIEQLRAARPDACIDTLAELIPMLRGARG